MYMIKLTAAGDHSACYFNPRLIEAVSAVNPKYGTDTLIFCASCADGEPFKVIESVETVVNIIEDAMRE